MDRASRVGTGGRRYKSACLAQGTLLDTPLGPRPVELIGVGDQLWGFDESRREPVVVKVRSVERSTADEIICVGGLRVTVDHPILVEGLWRPAGELKPKDRLLASNLKPLTAGRIEVVNGTIDVFDLKVAPPENFFAGGLLVHNKMTG